MSEPQVKRDTPAFASRIQPAYLQVADQLRSSILDSEVGPGERLPIESDLASMFGVSRSTIREALRVLSSERLVRTVRGVGGGSFVSQPDAGHVSDFLQTSIGLLTRTHLVSLTELVEARAILEVPAARFAAARATEEDVARLRSASAADLVDGSQRLEESRDFHFELLRVAGNRLMEVMAGPVFSVLAQRYLQHEIPKGRWAELAKDHEAITAAIETAQTDRAAALMRDHIGRVGELYRESTED